MRRRADEKGSTLGVSDRWQKEELELKRIQAELQHQQAVLAKEVQDLKETLEVRSVVWGWTAGVAAAREGGR